MERVVLKEGQFVRLAAGGWLHVEVVELVRSPSCRGVDEPFSINRNMRPRPIERLFRENRRRLVDAIRDGRHPQHVAGPERHVAIRDEQQLLSVGKPGGRDVHVHTSKVQTVATEAVVAGDRDLVASKVSVFNRANEDVEVSRRVG